MENFDTKNLEKQKNTFFRFFGKYCTCVSVFVLLLSFNFLPNVVYFTVNANFDCLNDLKWFPIVDHIKL